MTEEQGPEKSQRLKIHFELGTVLYIEQGRDGERLQSTVVGVMPQSCLIVKLPAIVGIDNPLAKDRPIEVRYVDDGEILGFETTVLGSISSPFPLTFLSFPRGLRKTSERRHARIDCYIPATLKYDVFSKSGVIFDISVGGCRLKLRDISDVDASELGVGREVILYFPLLGLQGVRECSGIVRNITLDSEGISIGVEFDTVEPELVDMIETYTKADSKHKR